MSEPDSAEIGRSIGDNSEETLRTTLWPSAPPLVLPDSSILPATSVRLATVAAQIHLESRFDPTEVTGPADSQLDQPRQPMFCRHSACSILVVGNALLQRWGPASAGLPGDGSAPAVPSCVKMLPRNHPDRIQITRRLRRPPPGGQCRTAPSGHPGPAPRPARTRPAAPRHGQCAGPGQHRR